MNRNSPGAISVRAFGLFFIAAMGVCLVWILLAPPRASAATFTVTKTADTNDGVCGGDCSLREAVIAANSIPGADVITLPSGTYILTISGTNEDNAATGDLDIKDNLTLSGAGANMTIINGGGIDRVFQISSNVIVSISNLTVSGGVLTGFGKRLYPK